MGARFWLVLAVFTAFGAVPARAEVMVYELFTARDCPSCPAADEIFSQVARANPRVIALACHVTYFNRPGRYDALSAPFCDGRQTGYKTSKIVRKLYTPAVVLNGHYEVKGTSRNDVLTGLAAAKMERVPRIPLALEGGYLTITLPAADLGGAAADVWLFAYDKGNAVTGLTKLMRWNGRSSAMAFPVQSMPGAGYAVIAQTARQTNIIAAGKTN